MKANWNAILYAIAAGESKQRFEGRSGAHNKWSLSAVMKPEVAQETSAFMEEREEPEKDIEQRFGYAFKSVAND